ncbi:MAG: preprotein translocase subunit YajC [Candidatus Dasytiphilus stammeri]
MILISEAIAATNHQPIHGNPYSLIIMLGIFGIIFYSMIWTPQKKTANEHKKMIESIVKGDEIMTTGGIVGEVTKVIETGYIIIMLNETTKILIKRDFVSAILPKGTMKALKIQ